MTSVSAPAEIASARLRLRRLVSNIGYPYLVVRLGVAHREAAAVDTPRPSAGVIAEVR